ncbi:MAG: hypothetical protein IKP47_01535 [Ruminococcus sp.]|nr:hypothetical protein [Ruminococcus sp.]
MKDEFGGYYFKAQSETQTLAVIAAFHNSNGAGSCSIQIISDSGVWSAAYTENSYSKSPKGFRIRLSENYFTEKGMNLDIHRRDLTVTGRLRFGSFTPIRYDIMGPFCAVPFMECRHTVVSMRHRVDGTVTINGEKYVFKDAVGYIEGDRGTSFPKHYTWSQCCFENGSLMLSVADIPIGPVNFKGVIGVVMLDGKEHRIATYLGAKVIKLGDNSVTVKQGNKVLTATLIEKRAHPLAAPVSGSMIRTIHESASCTASFRLEKKGEVLLDLLTDKASFEYEW